MYSGFELCEAAPLPGREEYLDSEKYEIRAARLERARATSSPRSPQLNRIRAEPIRRCRRISASRFYNAFNDSILYYGKATPDRANVILVAVSLDPHHAQEADFEMPLWEWGCPTTTALRVRGPDARRHASIWTRQDAARAARSRRAAVTPSGASQPAREV